MSVPVVLSWSGGKDSVLALDVLRSDRDYEVVALLTTLTREYDRIAMHGVRRELLARQAESVGLPLVEVWITAGAGNEEYESAMGERLVQLRDDGISTIAFGDLFLEDIREYRTRLIDKLRMSAIFPVWGTDTNRLARHFLERGFRALTCCVDTQAIPDAFCGRELTSSFFQELPTSVDPCGENGEFHTFVFDGPLFRQPVNLRSGDERRQGQFVFRDLIALDPLPDTL